MSKRVNARIVSLLLAAAMWPVWVFGAGAGAGEVMKLMPADFPVSVVVVDFEKFDRSVTSLIKRINPQHDEEGMVASFKKELPIGEWIDFGKPMGLAIKSLGSNQKPALWVRVPDFATKAKGLEGAKEEEGVWNIPVKDDEPLFVRVRGEYVVASPDKELLNLACKEGRSVDDELKSRMELLRDRDVLIHVNFDAVRPMASAGLAQAAQMAPMLVMMAGQQAGNPAALAGMANALVDTAKQLVDQIAFVEIVVGLTEKAADLTLATGYREGAIKTYLAKQKPAGVPLLAEVEDQPYLLAFGYHTPGTDSPFMDYLFGKLEAALSNAPGATPGAMPGSVPGSGTEGQPGAATEAGAGKAKVKEALQIHRDLYRKVEGGNMVMAMTPGGMKVAGDYLGSDAKTILDLLKKSLTAPNPVMGGVGNSAAYEARGTQRIGEATVEEFGIKIPAENPMAEQAMKQMFGENARFLVGTAGGRVRFCMGTDEDAQRVFSGKISKPLASSQYVKEALEGLPAKRNAVALIDPAGILPLLGPMMGLPQGEPIPPGPPAAISISIAGEPARVDIHVPIRTIERVKQAVSPNEPM